MNKVLFENIREEIIENLRLCKNNLKIAVAWFTDKKIISEIENLLNNGISVDIIIYDNHVNKKDLFKKMYYSGANIFLSKKMMHNKFCVIDNKIVINGSYNWTINASNNNDENIQITINNSGILESFVTQFNKIKKNCRKIDDYFEYSLDNLEQINIEINKNLPKPNCNKPYFYRLNDLNLSNKNRFFNKLKKGYYLIRNSEEEYDFFRLIYLASSQYSLVKINNLQKVKVKTPPFFNFVDCQFGDVFNFFEIDDQYVKVEIWDKCSYVFFIDKLNNIKSDKIAYHHKLPNGNYLYSMGFPYMKHYLYDNNLKNLNLNLYDLKLELDIGIFGKKKVEKFNDKYKFGLVNFKNREIAEFIYDDYIVDKEKGVVDFIELPHIFKDINNNKISFLSKDLDSHYKFSNQRKITKYDYRNKKIISISTNENDKNYLFLSDENFKYLEFYQAFVGSGQSYKFIDVNNIQISDFDDLKIKFKAGYREFKNGYCGKSFMKNHDKFLEKLDAEYRLRGWKEDENKKEGCYIATMVYKSYDHPNVMILRNYRDNYLKRKGFGKKFIEIYYKISPKFVNFAKDKFLLNYISKLLINLIIKILKKTWYNSA